MRWIIVVLEVYMITTISNMTRDALFVGLEGLVIHLGYLDNTLQEFVTNSYFVENL